VFHGVIRGGGKNIVFKSEISHPNINLSRNTDFSSQSFQEGEGP
jgi:hypothetical protein